MRSVPMLAALLACGALLLGCDRGGSKGPSLPLERIGLESRMRSSLAGALSSADFSYCIERQSDGRSYTYNRGSSTMRTSYESASTSKLVSAAIILRVIDAYPDYLKLSSHPQDLLGSTIWPVSSSDSLYAITLADLLSFTSDLESDPSGPLYLATAGEVRDIAVANAGNKRIPGAEFYYSSNHLQVAGLMAIKARDAAARTAGNS